MKQEFVKIKMVLMAVVGIVFLSMVTLFLVVVMNSPAVEDQGIGTQEKLPFEAIDLAEEKAVNEDHIEFSDPGKDEIGNEVRELDELINNTMPSEYNEQDLTEDEMEGLIELQ